MGEKILRSLAAVLTVLALLFAAASLAAGVALARFVLFSGLAFAAIGIVTGLLLGRRHPLLQIAAAAVPAALLAWVAGRAVMIEPVYLYIMVAIGAILAVWAERLYVTAGESSAGLGSLLAPLGGWLAAALLLTLTARENPDAGQIWPLVIAAASIWFAVAMVALNRSGVRKAARANAESGIPAAVRRNGTVGAVLFVAVTFLIANVSALGGIITGVIKRLLYWVVSVISWLSSVLSPPTEGSQSPQGGEQQPMPAGGEASPLMQLLGVIVMVFILICVAAAILYGLYRLFPKLWRKLSERLKALLGSWHDSDDYSESSERLMTLGQALSGAGRELRKFARLFRRRERLSDFSTNAGRARFLFREYVRRLISTGRAPRPSATATEIARPAPALAHAYNLARYGEEEPSDGEVERAREEVFGSQ